MSMRYENQVKAWNFISEILWYLAEDTHLYYKYDERPPRPNFISDDERILAVGFLGRYVKDRLESIIGESYEYITFGQLLKRLAHPEPYGFTYPIKEIDWLLWIADRVRLSLSGRRWLWPSEIAPLGLSVAPFIVIIAPKELKEE